MQSTLTIQDQLIELYYALDAGARSTEELSAAGAVGMAIGSMAEPLAMVSPAAQIDAARNSLAISRQLIGTREGFYGDIFEDAINQAGNILDTWQE